MSPVKVWFITGCTSGLGEALAFEVLNRGDKCIATARGSLDRLDALKRAGADIVQFDVTASLVELQKKAREANSIHGQIDYLINNAGYLVNGSFEELSPEETQKQFDTNVFGLINVSRAFLPIFRQQGSGVIGNVSSIGGWAGYPGAGIYCGSKWAVSGISECMTPELAEFGIKVCSIEPGYFRSKLLNKGQRQNGSPQSRIAAYDGSAARRMHEMLCSYDGHQPGDLRKGAKIVFDVLSQQDGKEVPLRLPLGTDAYDTIKKKCEDTLALLADYKNLICSTDHDDVKQK